MKKRYLFCCLTLILSIGMLFGCSLDGISSNGSQSLAPEDIVIVQSNLADKSIAPSIEPSADPEPITTPSQTPKPTPQKCKSFSIIWMSDTQLYSESYPEIFNSMTSWIVSNKEKRNIKYVLHTGDVVNNKAAKKQWTNARSATQEMMCEVPFFVIAGNHDVGSKKRSFSAFSDSFGPEIFADGITESWFYNEGEARYDLFEVDGAQFIIVGLSYAPSKGAIDWIDSALEKNIDRTAILGTHNYLHQNAKLSSQGKTIFNSLVSKHSNVKIVVSGHHRGTAILSTDIDDDGDGKKDRTVQQLFVNYQGEKLGGEGYLVILKFDPENEKVDADIYSPYLNTRKLFSKKDDIYSFALDVPLAE